MKSLPNLLVSNYITFIISILTLDTFIVKSYCYNLKTQNNIGVLSRKMNLALLNANDELNNYRNDMFKEIDHRQKNQSDLLKDFISNQTIPILNNNYPNIITKQTNLTNHTITTNHSITTNHTVITTINPISYVKHTPETEYTIAKRDIKFYISEENKCNVIVDDIVHYERLSNHSNILEHMILHNNAESIEPVDVTSKDLKIISFAFNKKLNIFSVFFENPDRVVSPAVEYKYLAVNLIKTNLVSISDENKSKNDTNSFIWKVVNQNVLKLKEKMNIEVYFDKFKNMDPKDIKFSLNFTKILPLRVNNNDDGSSGGNNVTSDNKDTNDFNDHFMVKYLWKGALKLHEVVIIEVTFPMIFEDCGNIYVNIFVVGIGAVFVVFLVGMLFFIFSSLFFEEV